MVISSDFLNLQVTRMESENKHDVKGKVSKLEVASYDNGIQELKQEQEIEGSAATIKIEKCENNVIEGDELINEAEKKFNCDICDKKFSKQSYLHKHQKIHNTHSKKQTFECKTCDKVFLCKATYL